MNKRLINVNKLLGKTIAIYGLSKTGISAAKALGQRGIHIILWDENKDKIENAASLGFVVKNLHEADFSKIDYLIWSPGIPHTLPTPNPIALKAKEHNVPIVCDIEFFTSIFTNGKYIGITGTNGKSTTTGLIHHIFKTAGKETAIGGNYGIPVFDLPELSNKGFYILELSSYQIELSPSLNMDCAILTNISEDHIDRHKDMNGYISVKKRIFNRVDDKAHFNIITVDDKYSQKVFEEISDIKLKDTTVPVSSSKRIKGVYVDSDGVLKDNFWEKDKKIFDLSKLENLQGKHNWQNIAISYAVSKCYDIDTEQFKTALQTFTNLPHRMEKIPTEGMFENIQIINDSKGTNADATQYPLQAYSEIYWIAGGRPKSDGIDPLIKFIKPSKIFRAYMIGEATRPFHKIVKERTKSYRCWTLKKAVKKAFKHMLKDMKKGYAKNPTLLLSPSATSWDQFKSFEDRGDQFKQIVKEVMNKYDKKSK